MLTASAATPAAVTPLSFALGLIALGLFIVALSYAAGAVRWLTARHRAGVARVAAYDARTVEARRRARLARRTVVDVDATGRVAAITVERRR